ncbi:presqualene diphosphate synthase HpnD [Cupriavidus sp. SZY C1]|uniref:presqualene diphosphate synthase HpnD n=1 Tax=Cupriavidus sp. SZY C1 TaxID=3055037 RepID=UPI0028BC0E87|nr:presqualene diphosphate synthase HpnD [Cupriavidus sp. SZY C1]MDT6962709.1 presqualene diphosphate synthase HpnD [Cupriavidus sp. SZY C1]
MTPDQYCQDKAATSGSSFYYSSLLLPPERRRALTALQAWRLELDAIVHEDHDAGVALQRLDWWRAELRRLYDGTPNHPVSLALQPHLASLPQAEMSQVLDGTEMDLAQSRYFDDAALGRYARLVGGTVGRLTARLLGFTDALTLDAGEKLGLSQMRVRIIREVGRDARQGRIYIPVETLQRFEVPAADIMQSRHSAPFVTLMRDQAAQARALYQEALDLLPRADRRAQRAALALAAIHHALLDEIEASDFQVLTQRISLTPMRKLWVAWKTWLRNR